MSKDKDDLLIYDLEAIVNAVIELDREIAELITNINQIECLPGTLSISRCDGWKSALTSKLDVRIQKLIKDYGNEKAKVGKIYNDEMPKIAKYLNPGDFEHLDNYCREVDSKITTHLASLRPGQARKSGLEKMPYTVEKTITQLKAIRNTSIKMGLEKS
ncbi:hypothetical protein WR25_20119 [Diploscapter pachys]|uniref:Uncharacterized protein n=1 Tax=Diploscapter pachys TaxID=2018661 RepID=A0A2A2M070_9BILA|nr:hypothetical protein WR25_20119 [Diploscapter pachys]